MSAESIQILDASFVASSTDLRTLPAPMFAEIAFAGRSNVGKSSLINSLVQRKNLVRTSGTPGCTRGINVFRVVLQAQSRAEIDFVDLPGYGYARRSKTERATWGPMIEAFLEQRPGLAAVVILVDVRRGFEEEEAQLVEFLAHIDRRALLVATKLDKLPNSKQKPALEKLKREVGQPVLGYSSTTGKGRDQLWRRLLRLASIAV